MHGYPAAPAVDVLHPDAKVKSMMHSARHATRVSTAVVAGALALGGVLGSSAPAFAGGSGKIEISSVRAEAWTWTSGGTEGRSYAQHGCASFLSSWGNVSTNAWASCGLAGGTAWYEFR